MKILFVGGTGNISTAVSRLAVDRGHQLHLLNRGKRESEVRGARSIVADIHDEKAVSAAIDGEHFDVVANFISFSVEDI